MPPEDSWRELSRQWLAFAADDLAMADRAGAQPALPAMIAFHSQQAAEKALKGFLFWRDRPFQKTHVLTDLVKQCVDLDDARRARESAEQIVGLVRDRLLIDDPAS
jgi:HEPN domain-containing protein